MRTRCNTRKGLLALAVVGGACDFGGFTRHMLTPLAEQVRMRRRELHRCAMIGTFRVLDDCHTGPINVDVPTREEQIACIKWKASEAGGTHAVIDTVEGYGYAKGRIFGCATDASADASADAGPEAD